MTGPDAVLVLGLLLGVAFGAVGRATNFCTLGAISDRVLFGDGRRLRAWALAAAVALALSQALHAAGLVDLSRSMYARPVLAWPGAILGGLMFGYGMALAGGCGMRTLVRLGGGSLRALTVALTLAVFAYVAMHGLLSVPRTVMEAGTALPFAAPTQSLPDLLAALTGWPPGLAAGLATLLVAGGIAAWCFADRRFATSLPHAGGGAAIGALVALGWVVTGVAGQDDFDPAPLQSLTFVAPIGDAVVYAMTASGASLDFGIVTVVGVVLGAMAVARARGEIRADVFRDAADFRRSLGGAALMGVGGVLALGCTVGQGISAFSTLAASAFLVLPAIGAGAVLALKAMERSMESARCA